MTATRKWTGEEITEINQPYCEEKLSLTKIEENQFFLNLAKISKKLNTHIWQGIL